MEKKLKVIIDDRLVDFENKVNNFVSNVEVEVISCEFKAVVINQQMYPELIAFIWYE